MKSETVRKLMDKMATDPWQVRLQRWMVVKAWTLLCLSRRWWDSTHPGYMFRIRK